MKIRPALIIGFIAVAAIGFGAGIAFVEYSGLSPKQSEQTKALVSTYLTAHPELVTAPAPMTPMAPAMTPDKMIVSPEKATGANRPADLSDDQRAEVEAIIKNYLIANPEIIRDSINELQRKEDADDQAQQAKIITDSKDLLFSSSREVVLGNPKGDVTLVEFFDYNCAYCRRAQADMKKLIENDKNLRIVLKEFPVLGDGSTEAAEVAVAVHLTTPERYGEFHDALIGEHGQVNGERALAIAEEVGLDKAKIQAAMKSDEVKATINEVYALAGKLSLTGTPSYVTAKEVIVGAVGYDTLKQKIDEVRCGQANC